LVSGLIYPGEKDSAGVFVVWNLLQCVACSAGLIYSEYMMLQYQTFIDVVFLILSLATFLKLDLIVLPLNIAQSKAKESLQTDRKEIKNE